MARVGAAVLAAGVTVAAACLVPDPLSPAKELTNAPASSSAPSMADTTSLTTWARAQLRGLHTVRDIALFRSHEGRLLGSRILRYGLGVVYDDFLGMPPDDIEVIEVLKGPARGVPHVGSVVVITLRAGKQLAKGMDDSFEQYLGQFLGCASLYAGGVRIYLTRDGDGVMRCR